MNCGCGGSNVWSVFIFYWIILDKLRENAINKMATKENFQFNVYSELIYTISSILQSKIVHYDK